MNFDEKALQLQPHYSRFSVANRLLFTGHSHQAWPDCAFDGLTEYFETAATQVDKKWGLVFEKVEQLRNYLKNWYKDSTGQYSVATSTHDLLIKWLSALRLQPGDEILTTTHEFYSVYRQLKSLEQESIVVRYLEADTVENLADKLISNLNPKVKAVIVSRVFYDSGLLFPNLKELASACSARQIPMLIDDYHGTNVKPEKIGGTAFEQTYWLIGGYKYLQWGEGNCFLRYPADCALKPIYTGWFASFSTLNAPKETYSIQFDSHMKFGGATFEPVSAFRAAKVVEFFEQHQLDATWLEQMYATRVGELLQVFKSRVPLAEFGIELVNDVNASKRGGFLALKAKNAVLWHQKLLEKGVFTDARGTILRFGPAPYTTTEHMHQVTALFNRIIEENP